MELTSFSDDAVALRIRACERRVACVAPGVTDSVAAALIEVRRRVGRDRVRVVLDASAQTLRLGYGQSDSMAMLLEHDVDVRMEPGCASASS